MKTLDKTPFAEYPDFWNEEWLRRAINELNTRSMTAEERYQFARITAKNAEAINAENQKIEEIKRQTIRKLLKQGKLSVDDVADANDVPLSVVLDEQRKMGKGE